MRSQHLFHKRLNQSVQCILRLAFRSVVDDFGYVWSLSVLSLYRLCIEVQLVLRYLLFLREFNICEFNGRYNLRDPSECDKLPLLYLPERKRIHLHVVMSLPAHGPDLLPNG